MYCTAPASPAAFPRAAAFANATATPSGGTRAPRRKRIAGRSLRAALIASGANPARVSAKLAAALAIVRNGGATPFPRGF